MTPEAALASVVAQYPLLPPDMHVVYASHPGWAFWPATVNGVTDYKGVEVDTNYSYDSAPSILLHEAGHALNYWAGQNRAEGARFIQTTQGPIEWDSVRFDFYVARGFPGDYVTEEVHWRTMQAQGYVEFGTGGYYQYMPKEQFANCFAATYLNLTDESLLNNTHTNTYGIPLNLTRMSDFFQNVLKEAFMAKWVSGDMAVNTDANGNADVVNIRIPASPQWDAAKPLSAFAQRIGLGGTEATFPAVYGAAAFDGSGPYAVARFRGDPVHSGTLYFRVVAIQ